MNVRNSSSTSAKKMAEILTGEVLDQFGYNCHLNQLSSDPWT